MYDNSSTKEAIVPCVPMEEIPYGSFSTPDRTAGRVHSSSAEFNRSSESITSSLLRTSEDIAGLVPSSPKMGPQSFNKVRLLGRGDVGRVYLVSQKGTDKLFAMKILDKETMIQRKKVRSLAAVRSRSDLLG